MAFTQKEKIIIIARLQAYLSEFSKEPHLYELCEKINKTIHPLMNETVAGLELKPIRVLLEEFRTFSGQDAVSMFDVLLVEKRLKTIGQLRKQAITANKPLDLSEYHDGLSQVPIKLYSWQSVISQFSRMIDEFDAAESSYEYLTHLSRDFFGNAHKGFRPPLFPDLTDTIIRELITRGLVSSMNAADLIDDINRIRQFTAMQSRQNREKIFSGDLPVDSFLKMGHDAYQFLEEYRVSSHLKKNIDVCSYLILWDGPGKARFLKKFAEMAPVEKNLELCMACTGVHPEKSQRNWLLMADLEIEKDLKGFRETMKLIEENRFVYEFLYVINFEGSLETPISKGWKAVFEKIKSDKEILVPEPAEQSCKPAQKLSKPAQKPLHPVCDTALSNTHLSKQQPLSTASIMDETVSYIPDESSDMDIDDLSAMDELSAMDKKTSFEDQIVQEHSTWNKYLKPFLSENLLGILGAALLMLAWLCISIWVWNKGQYYRLLTGALPMYFTSVALAYISRFFYKNLHKGVSPKAPALFATICVLSIPFNYLIALSMFYLDKTIGPVAGTGLGILYAITLFALIGRWIKDSIGFNPGLYLIIINTILFLPGFSLYAGAHMLPAAITIIMFATFFVYGYTIHAVLKKDQSKHWFRTLLFGVNYLLTLFICCVYYRIIPDAGSMAILLQLIALGIIFFGQQERIYKQLILTSVLSVLGILLSFKSVLPVTPFCLLLSAALWLLYKKYLRAALLDNIITAHIFCFFASIVFEIKDVFLPSGRLFISSMILSAAVSLVCAVLYEKKYSKTAIQSISYLIFPVLLSFQATLFLKFFNGWAGFLIMMILSFFVFVYGYIRYAKHYLRTLWFLNLGAMLIVPCLGLLFMHRFDAALMSFAFMGLVWTLASIKLKDALAHVHKTAVSLIISMIAMAVFIFACLVFYFEPPNLTMIMVLAFISLLVSLSLSAKNTMSQLPVYLIFSVSCVFGMVAYKATGIQMKTGLGTGVASLGFLYASHLFKKHGIWQSKSFDTIFNRELPLRSKQFLSFPFELAGWAMALIACIKVCSHYTLLNSGPHHFSFFALKIVLTLLIVSFVFYYFVIKYNFKQTGFIVFLPAILIFCSASSYVPAILQPLWLVLCLFIYDIWSRTVKIKVDHEASLKSPIVYMNTFFNHAGAVLGFLFYVYYTAFVPESFWNKHLLFASVTMVCAYMHKTLIVRKYKRYSHLILLHLIILITFGYVLFKQDAIVNAVQQSSGMFLYQAGSDFLKLLILAGLIFFIPGFSFERSKNKIAKYYSDVFHTWLFGVACVFSFCVSVPFFYGFYGSLSPVFLNSLLYIVIAGYFLIHAGNRYFKTAFLYIAKAFVCVYAGLLLMFEPLAGLIFGFTVFALLEALLCLGIKHKVTRPMESNTGDIHINYLNRLAKSAEVFVHIALVFHLIQFMRLFQAPPGVLLYLIIPYTVFCYRRLYKPYLGYLAVGIFAYANGFVAMGFHDFFIKNNLNTSHLLSISAMFTIFVFLVYNKVAAAQRREVEI
ncbi:hypothetical protein [Desulfobacula phenolica]|uniref:Uncharacterized protein n=1 Tax=Desulfobacula phenolica TaxID=90732 RepID=A0A1H2DNK6_9BACT|nr:hypothetical protein [Desulfobacula phenolica]SDT84314.1 hypothetical protein SAMN04487931_101200 [Desulfobacula phenolica]